MKRIFVYAAVLSGFLLVFLVVSFSPYSTDGTGVTYYTHTPYKAHLSVIQQDARAEFWQEFVVGCAQGLAEDDFVVEYIASTDVNPEVEQTLLNKAVASKVQGILIQGAPSEGFLRQMEHASTQGIPVVTVNSDIQSSKRTAYVGPDNFTLGAECFTRLQMQTAAGADIAVFTDDYASAEGNAVLQGFAGKMEQADGYTVLAVEQTMMSVLDAVEKAEKLLLRQPGIDVYFCTNPVATLGVARAAVNLNKVSEVQIIGVGCTAELASYVQKGVVQYVVDVHPGEMGRTAMETLCRLSDGKEVADTTYTPYSFVDRDTAPAWLAAQPQAEELL